MKATVPEVRELLADLRDDFQRFADRTRISRYFCATSFDVLRARACEVTALAVCVSDDQQIRRDAIALIDALDAMATS